MLKKVLFAFFGVWLVLGVMLSPATAGTDYNGNGVLDFMEAANIPPAMQSQLLATYTLNEWLAVIGDEVVAKELFGHYNANGAADDGRDTGEDEPSD